MAFRFKVSPFKNPSGQKAWRVSGTRVDGKRIRRNFTDRTDALSWRLELEDEAENNPNKRASLRSTILSEEELADAEAAFLSSGNRSLSSIVHQLLQVETLAQKNEISVESLLDFFKSHYRSSLSPITVYNAVEVFIESKKKSGLYEKTISYYRNSLTLLIKTEPNRMLHEFSMQDIEAILLSYKNLNTRRTYKRAFTSFFNWALNHEHIIQNPCEKLEKVPQDDRKIEILPLSVVKQLLRMAMDFKNGEMVTPLAVALFAGLRPSEVESLSPSDIRQNKIRVTGGKLRRTSKRMVPISDNLQAWLKAYPVKRFPTHYRDSFRRFKEASDHKNWVQDILRHTSISYQYARDEDEARVAFQNGTSGKMIHSNYLEVIDNQDDIPAYWSITPESLKTFKAPKVPPTKTKKKISWPTDRKLKSMYASMSLVQMGKAIGVSDNAVRKRLKKLGLI